MARWLALGVLGCIAAPACSDAFGIDDVLGIWNTQSINGYSVPGTVVYEGDSYDTQYVDWAFYDGGRCTLTQRVDGVTDTYDECDYTVNLEQETVSIVLLSEMWDGSVEEDSMTLTDPQDVVWILRKQ
ncbi:MAG: hypothetical protein GTO22_04575 [Gemmatimonadales bacterium]|nr:hypothetical protein [Gemmatimonadales bacterium]NIN10206.1 hypothetical protein [Gemmatimonadales bacterium]